MVVDKAEKFRTSLTLTRAYLDLLDGLVDEGFYMERQSAIREFIRDGFKKHGLEPFKGLERPFEEDEAEEAQTDEEVNVDS